MFVNVKNEVFIEC